MIAWIAVPLHNLQAQITQSESLVNSTPVLDKHSVASVPSLPPNTGISEMKFNVVIYGIAENPPKTNKETRQKEDLNSLLTSFQENWFFNWI